MGASSYRISIKYMVEDNYKVGDWVWDGGSKGLPLGQVTRDGKFSEGTIWADWYGSSNRYGNDFRDAYTSRVCRFATPDEINKFLPKHMVYKKITQEFSIPIW